MALPSTPIKFTQLNPGTLTQFSDVIPAVDTQDTSMDPTGTDKKYLQSQVFNAFLRAQGYTVEATSYAATTGNFAATYNNGTGGVGATLTATSDGVFTTDGVTPPLNSIILVAFQTDETQNGLYVLTTVGSVSAPAVLTRSPTWNSSGAITQWQVFAVTYGSTYANTAFQYSGATSATVGTTLLPFILMAPVEPSDIQNCRFNYTTSSSDTADAYTAFYSPAIVSYNDGTTLGFLCNGTNTTTTPTFNPDGLGAALIVNNADGPINIGDMVQNCNVWLTYNDNGHWQLMNPATAGGVTPAEIQECAFNYSANATYNTDGYTGFYTPTVTSTPEGTTLGFHATHGNVTTSTTFNADGLGDILIVDSAGNNLDIGDIVAGQSYWVTKLSNGNWQLLNPFPVTPAQIQKQTFVYSGSASNIGDAYSVSFTPSIVSLAAGTQIEITIPSTNTTTTPTLTVNGLGPTSIVLANGSPISIGDMTIGGNSVFSFRTDNQWQLLNPAISETATPQVIGTFTPQLRNYTLTGGTGLVQTGNYIATGANLFVTMEFSNPGGYIATLKENGNFANLPALPVSPVEAQVITNAGPVIQSDFYNSSSATAPYDSFGIVAIQQGGITYLVAGVFGASVVFSYSVDQTTTSPGFQLTPIGGAQTVTDSSELLYTFNNSSTDYIVGIDNGTSQILMTFLFNAGTVSNFATTALTHVSNLQEIALFTFSGSQYCVVLEDNGGTSGEFFETFLWNGSGWTATAAPFNTGVRNTNSRIVYNGGSVYLLTLDSSTHSVQSYTFTGTTWTSLASAVVLTNPTSQLTAFNFNSDAFFVVADDAINVYLYKWNGSSWNLEYSTTFGSSGGFGNLISLSKNGTEYVQAISADGHIGIWTLYYDTTSQLQNLTTFSNTSTSGFVGQETAFNIGTYSYMFGTSLGLGSVSSISGYAFYDDWTVDSAFIPTDGVGFFQNTLDSFATIRVQATYQTGGIGSIVFPGSVVQQFSTILAPLPFTSGTNQTYVFDATVGPSGPITYSSGNFGFPSDFSRSWEIIGQFNMSTAAVTNMRLHISSPFTTDFFYSSPVVAADGTWWCYVSWRGAIAAGATMQLLFNSASSGQFENGAGQTSYMTIREI